MTSLGGRAGQADQPRDPDRVGSAHQNEGVEAERAESFGWRGTEVGHQHLETRCRDLVEDTFDLGRRHFVAPRDGQTPDDPQPISLDDHVPHVPTVMGGVDRGQQIGMEWKVETLSHRRGLLVQIDENGGHRACQGPCEPDCDLGDADTSNRADDTDAERLGRPGPGDGHRSSVRQRGNRNLDKLVGGGVGFDHIRDPALEQVSFGVGCIGRVVDADDLTSPLTKAANQTRGEKRADVVDDQQLELVGKGLRRAHDPGTNPTPAVIEEESMQPVRPVSRRCGECEIGPGHPPPSSGAPAPVDRMTSKDPLSIARASARA